MASKAQQRTNAGRPNAVQLRARRSPRLIALGILAVVMGALGSVALHNATTETMSVVGLARHVERGQVLAAEDFTVVEVPQGFSVPTTPSSELDALIGQNAMTDLPLGSFPMSSHFGDDPLAPGEALVGLRMQYGQLPVSAMPKGRLFSW